MGSLPLQYYTISSAHSLNENNNTVFNIPELTTPIQLKWNLIHDTVYHYSNMADSENSKKGQDGASKSLGEKEKKRKGHPLDTEEGGVAQVEKDLSKLKIKEGRYRQYCVVCRDTFNYHVRYCTI